VSTNPLAIPEARIVIAASEQAQAALRDEAIARATACATDLRSIVIASDGEAARVTDMVAVVKDGRRIADALLSGLVAPLKKATDAARYAFAPITDVLKDAEEQGKRGLRAWAAEKERQAAAIAAKLAAEAREAQERQQAELEALWASGEAVAPVPEPPPMEAPPPVVKPATTYGSRAMSFGTTEVQFEVVDIVELATHRPDLIEVRQAATKKMFREVEESLKGTPQHELGGWVVNGVRCWRARNVAIR
jgi:hypothetical protein